jgi:DNA-binding LacI/PurR family transcriptional regulator
MKDIARRAGVSTATVSRALHDDPSVTEATRAHVRREAFEVGYVMHRQAQGLRSQRSGIIAVHVPFAERVLGGALGDPFVLEFVSVLGTALHQAGLDMLVAQSASLDPALHRSRLVDGYVLLNHGDRHTEIRHLAEAGVPIVVWVAPSTAHGFCAVGPDNTRLARTGVEHLLGLGRRRIGLIVDDIESTSTEGSLRFDGYRQALELAGIQFDPDLVAVTRRRDGAGQDAINQILHRSPNLDAVFVAFSDAMALTVQRELIDLGNSVPDDIAVIGFDNIGIGEYSHPRLTTIDPGLRRGVPLLIDKLTRQINGEPVTSEVVEGSLVVRESCGFSAPKDRPTST